MLKTQFIQKRQFEDKISLMKDSIKSEIKDTVKQSAKEGAYEGVLEAKLDLLTLDHNKQDYNSKDTPMTTREFDNKNRLSWLIKGGLILTLFIFGFIDFIDVLNFLFSPFS